MIYKKNRIKYPGIGKRVKTIMDFKKISQKEFSSSLGVKQSNISQIVNEISNPSTSILKFISCFYSINEKWLLTGEGPMERKTGNGNGVAEELRNDPKLIDIFKLLQDDREARDMVYEILVGKKQVERVAKIVKKLLSRKIEDLMQADLKEDPMLVDIMRILAANPATKHTIYKFLETDMNCARSLEIFKKHFEDKFAEKTDPPPGNSSGL